MPRATGTSATVSDPTPWNRSTSWPWKVHRGRGYQKHDGKGDGAQREKVDGLIRGRQFLERVAQRHHELEAEQGRAERRALRGASARCGRAGRSGRALTRKILLVALPRSTSRCCAGPVMTRPIAATPHLAVDDNLSKRGWKAACIWKPNSTWLPSICIRSSSSGFLRCRRVSPCANAGQFRCVARREDSVTGDFSVKPKAVLGVDPSH